MGSGARRPPWPVPAACHRPDGARRDPFDRVRRGRDPVARRPRPRRADMRMAILATWAAGREERAEVCESAMIKSLHYKTVHERETPNTRKYTMFDPMGYMISTFKRRAASSLLMRLLELDAGAAAHDARLCEEAKASNSKLLQVAEGAGLRYQTSAYWQSQVVAQTRAHNAIEMPQLGAHAAQSLRVPRAKYCPDCRTKRGCTCLCAGHRRTGMGDCKVGHIPV